MNRIRTFLILAGASLCTDALAELSYTHSEVRAQYVGSKDLPDGVAFVEFLRLLEPEDGVGDEYAMALVSEALKLPRTRKGKPDTAAIAAVQLRLKQFRDTHQRMRSERDRTAHDVMCGGNSFATSDEAFDSMNVVDDMNEFAAEKTLRVELRQLSARERKALLAYLDDLKTGISYVKVESRAQYGESMTDMSDDEKVARIKYQLETSCGALAAKISTSQIDSTRGVRP